MNKRFILTVGGLLLVGTFLGGAIWGWVTVLGYLIGVLLLGALLLTLMILGEDALLKTFLRNPLSWLSRLMNPYSRSQSRDLDDLFPLQITQGPDASEERPPIRFTKATEEPRERNTKEYKNAEPL